MKIYPKYYRLEGLCIMRKSDTTGKLVRIPDTAQAVLPLIMDDVTYPGKERFDEQITSMEETTLEVFEDYVKHFCGRVQIDIDRPMTDRAIKKQLEKNNFTLNLK